MLLLNGLLVPLFMGGFAYLFLVFPIARTLSLPFRHGRVRPEWVLAPAVPASIVYTLAFFDVHPLLLRLNSIIGLPYFLACVLGGVGALVASWRQAETPRAHAQLRIIGSGTILAVLPFFLLNLLPQITSRPAIIPAEYTALPLALIPLAFGYAILRYQIMNLHLYVRRGVVYSALGALITAIYALTLAIATMLVRDRAARLDAVLVPTMVALVVIMGDRLRAATQHRIDRLFDRQGYDYRRQLQEFSRRMNGILDPDELAQSSVELIAQTMRSRHVRLYLFDPGAESYRLWVAASVGAPADDAVLGPRHASVAEVRAAGWEIVQHFEIEAREDALLVPLVHKNQPVALLTLGLKRADLPYSSEDLGLLRTVASQLAIATENAQLYGRMRDLYLSGIRTLAATVDAKDSYTRGHSERVAAYARAIAVELGLPQLAIETIELAGLLHDIGKIGVPDAVLQKPGRLDPDERTLIEQHADLGARILSDNLALAPLVPLIRHHHERYDGGGYPSGLHGEAIPLGAAIIAVADTYDTMTTDRPYRRAPGPATARAEIAGLSGSQFHPRAVAAFLRVSDAPQWLAEPQRGTAETNQGHALAGQASDVNSRAMRVVYQIAQLSGSAIELPAFLGRVLDILRRELGTKVIDVFIVDRATNMLHGKMGPMDGWAPFSIPRGQGLVGWVAEHQTAVRLDETRGDPRVLLVGEWEGRSEIAVPLINNGRTVAVLNAESARTAAFSAEDLTLLTIIAGQLAQAVEMANLHEEITRAALVDGLTGIPNHRHFSTRLEAAFGEAERSGTALALAMLDVDGLKALNDTFGHLVGDAALHTVARLLDEHRRPEEFVARYGGDEFAIIFAGLDSEAATARAEALLGAIRAAETFETIHGTMLLPDISVGVASLDHEVGHAPALIALADARMYRQKRARHGTLVLPSAGDERPGDYRGEAIVTRRSRP